ncbi:hypothetical protein BGZ60DRAFT_388228 [Tricladium varicosporioides]|nr:hypothetical protein BGZ60DRAFT_388228 [Hymenoscyphus varicosporioides]
MEKAKQAVSSFLSKDGKHDTTVHETINPSVQNEHVTRTQHNKAQTAVDREVHQDHFHTSVQPIQDREVLPEQHTHQVVGVEHRNIKHGNDDHVKQRLEKERNQFKDTRTTGETHHTSSADAAITGEHVHHHVHENIQPVVQKETIQPSVIHTTIPIHEVHQNEAKHHTATQLPAVSMSEFQKQGGHLGGREERTDAFGGEPRSTGGTLGGAGARGTTSLTENESSGGAHGHHGTSNIGSTSHAHGSHSAHTGPTAGAAGVGATTGTAGTGVGSHAHNTTSNSSNTATSKKPSLMDKLNPKKDADGDGKTGFMD